METKLDVLYEDNHLIVVVKPQNVPTQGDSSGDTSLLDMVKEYIKVKENKPGEAFVGLVHRLDRPTGGVMVFAKTSKCAKRLAEQLSDGSFEKNYFAVTVSTPRERQGRIESWLVKDRRNRGCKKSRSRLQGFGKQRKSCARGRKTHYGQKPSGSRSVKIFRNAHIRRCKVRRRYLGKRSQPRALGVQFALLSPNNERAFRVQGLPSSRENALELFRARQVR